MSLSCESETSAGRVVIFGSDDTGKPFSETASLFRATQNDAVVGGIAVHLKCDDIVGLRYAGQKARFRLIWIGEKGTPREGQAGLFALEPEKDLWGAYPPLTAAPASEPVEAFPGYGERHVSEGGSGRDRRRHERVSVNGAVKFHTEGSETMVWATLQDLSAGGCYLETIATAPKFARLSLAINLEDLHLEAVGVVEASHPAYGMGVKFVHLTPLNRRALLQWVSRHETPAA